MPFTQDARSDLQLVTLESAPEVFEVQDTQSGMTFKLCHASTMERYKAERDALHQRLNSVEGENDRLRVKPAEQPQGKSAVDYSSMSAAERLAFCRGAQQPQGEPVALPARKAVTAGLLSESNTHNQGWNACLDEIAKLGPLFTHPAPAVQQEPVAWLDPSCGLTWLANRMDFAPGTKFYTRADPGEVERLRAEIERMYERVTPTHKSLIGKHAEIIKQRDTLRTQLAERDVLLTDLGVEPKEVSDIYQKVLKDAERYQLLRERLSVGDFPNPHPEWSTPTESESSRIDELCDAALSASAEPSAPVEIDERAEIKLDQVLRAYEYAEGHPHRYLRGTTNWCAAVAHSLNEQARAALAHKP